MRKLNKDYTDNRKWIKDMKIVSNVFEANQNPKNK